MKDIPPVTDDFRMWLYNWLAQVFYAPILSLVKLSVLVFLLRLAGPARKVLNIFIYTLICVNSAQCIAVVCVTIFQCTPMNLVWTTGCHAYTGMGHYINPAIFTITVAAINLLTDLLVMVIPFRIFSDITINKRIRNALMFVFTLGIWYVATVSSTIHLGAPTDNGSVTAISAVRLSYLYRIFYTIEGDPTYSLGFVLSSVESNLAIVAASVPALWPLARRWFPSMDNMLGLNQPLQPDIEVQAGAFDDLYGSVGRPARVVVRWNRPEMSPARSGTILVKDSPMAPPEGDGPSSGKGGAASCDGAGHGRDGLMLPSPSLSPQERHGKEEQDCFGLESPGVPVCDSYHHMIAVEGQEKKWAKFYNKSLEGSIHEMSTTRSS